MPKKLKGGPFSLSRYAKKEENIFGSVQLARWFNLGTLNFVELLGTISVSSSGLKKSRVDISHASLHEAPTKNVRFRY